MLRCRNDDPNIEELSEIQNTYYSRWKFTSAWNALVSTVSLYNIQMEYFQSKNLMHICVSPQQSQTKLYCELVINDRNCFCRSKSKKYSHALNCFATGVSATFHNVVRIMWQQCHLYPHFLK